MKTVTFLASKTNSAPTPEPEKKKLNSDGPLLIATFNAIGIGWTLWESPAIALLVAACIACISFMMRTSPWARLASMVASSAIVAGLILNPPSLPETGPRRYRAREAVKIDSKTAIALYIIAVAALGLVHHTVGEPDAPGMPAPAPPEPAKPEDPDAKLKRRGLDDWLQSDAITLSSDISKTESVDRVFSEYEKSFSRQYIKPPIYTLGEFISAFKTSTGKEPVDVKGVLSYLGVSFPSAVLV